MKQAIWLLLGLTVVGLVAWLLYKCWQSFLVGAVAGTVVAVAMKPATPVVQPVLVRPRSVVRSSTIAPDGFDEQYTILRPRCRCVSISEFN